MIFRKQDILLSVLLAAILDFALQRETHMYDHRGLLVCFPDRISGANLANCISPLFSSDLCQILC